MNTKFATYIISVLTLGLILSAIPHFNYSFAQEGDTTEPETTETSANEPNSDANDTIRSLKEKIEQKVDQINEQGKQVISGTISDIDGNDITVSSDSNQEYTVTLDDTITEYYFSTLNGSEEASVEDLEEDLYVVISGPVIETQISANIIFIQNRYRTYQGIITGTNSSAFTVDVVTQNKDELTLDIEDDTEQSLIDSSTLEVSEAGFSKYKVGDSIHFVIMVDDPEKVRFSAVRTLILPQEYFVQDEEDETGTADEETTTKEDDTTPSE